MPPASDNQRGALQGASPDLTRTRGLISFKYTSRSNDLQIGGALALSDTTTVGGAFNYGNFSAMQDGGVGSVSGDMARFTGFATWQHGNWRLSGAVDYENGWFDTSRLIGFGGLNDTLTGSTNGWQAGLHGRAAWYKETRWGWIEPRLDLSVIRNRIDGFVERGGSPFSLDVDGSSDTIVSTTPGIETGVNINLANGNVLRAKGSIGYQMLSESSWTNLARIDDRLADFKTGTSIPDRQLQLKLGLDWMKGEKLSVSAEFQHDIGSDYQSSQGALRLGYRF